VTERSAAATRHYEEHGGAADGVFYDLTLFVSGASALAARAIANARELCDGHLAGRNRLLVVDIHDDLAAVVSAQILAVPTLVRNLPLPVRKVVGDLSHLARVLHALDLPAVATASADEPQ
jgi:circadian clock protein KaiB